MKTYILAFFILFINISCSQDKKVTFENELTYNRDGNSFSWYVSNKYPNIILVRDTYTFQNFLYYLEKASYYSLNENNEIEYDKLNFQNEIINEVTEITKSEKTEVINGFECDKFIMNSDNELYEVFITNNSKINNIELNRIIINSDKSIFKSGLIIKINKYNSRIDEYRPYIELSDIKKSDKSIIVDFEKLNLRLNKPQKYPMIESVIAEPVED